MFPGIDKRASLYSHLVTPFIKHPIIMGASTGVGVGGLAGAMAAKRRGNSMLRGLHQGALVGGALGTAGGALGLVGMAINAGHPSVHDRLNIELPDLTGRYPGQVMSDLGTYTIKSSKAYQDLLLRNVQEVDLLNKLKVLGAGTAGIAGIAGLGALAGRGRDKRSSKLTFPSLSGTQLFEKPHDVEGVVPMPSWEESLILRHPMTYVLGRAFLPTLAGATVGSFVGGLGRIANPSSNLLGPTLVGGALAGAPSAVLALLRLQELKHNQDMINQGRKKPVEIR